MPDWLWRDAPVPYFRDKTLISVSSLKIVLRFIYFIGVLPVCRAKLGVSYIPDVMEIVTNLWLP